MMRLGLFEQLFWRVMLLLLAAPMLLLFFGHFYLENQILDGWRADLAQEAAWTARHWNAAPPEMLSKAWGRTHSSVRLTIIDAHGRVVADSRPDLGPPGKLHLSGRAPIALQDGTGTLILERSRRFVIPVILDLRLLLSLLGLVALSAAVLYPIVRRLKTAFATLADQARRVADGHFGETLAPVGHRELADLITAFNEMSLELEAQEARKRRLIADVSHELRSPMARLRALSETIQRRPKGAGPHLVQLEAEIALMDRLVGDMLQTARDDRKGLVLHKAPLHLKAWAEDVFARSRVRIEGAGVSCIVAISGPDLEASVDGQRLTQVLGALVENAINALAGRPDPTISLKLATTSEADWRLSVEDNGRGIPPDTLPFVFDRFFRVEPDRGRGSGGVGLGLSIAREVVEAHGGTIRIESEVDKGATVTVQVPR